MFTTEGVAEFLSSEKVPQSSVYSSGCEWQGGRLWCSERVCGYAVLCLGHTAFQLHLPLPVTQILPKPPKDRGPHI